VRVQGLIFAGIGRPAPAETARFLGDGLGVEPVQEGDVHRLVLGEADGELQVGYGFRYRHVRGPDGRRFELLDRG
jgi:hypothetical protein